MKGDEGSGDLVLPPTAVGNEALPPQSTAAASLAIPLHAQFAAASGTGYPVRGEKNWQAWAGDMETYGDMQTDIANTRIPYFSTL